MIGEDVFLLIIRALCMHTGGDVKLDFMFVICMMDLSW